MHASPNHRPRSRRGVLRALVTVAPMLTAAAASAQCLPFGPTGFAPPTSVLAIASADLNNDGHVDIVTTHDWVMPPALVDLSVYLADGAGGFLPPVSYVAAARPTSLALGDMDLDGDTDVVLTTINPAGFVIVMLNDGTGGFSAPPINVTLPTSSRPVSVVLSDLDLDNDLDVVFAKTEDFFISVLLNSGGTPMLLPPVVYTIPFEARDIDKADFDGDGDDDIVASGSNGVVVMRNNDAGAFNSVMASLPDIRGAEAVASGDIDDDGDIDIAFSGISRSDPAVRGVYFWLNTGPGTVYTPGTFLPRAGTTRQIELFRDAPPLASQIGPATRLAVTESRGVIDIYDGDGSGDFEPAGSYATGVDGSIPFSAPLMVTDLDDDGYADLTYARLHIGAVLRGTPSGKFGFGFSGPAGGTPTADLGLLTGNDDQLDLVIANEETDSLTLLRGDNGIFTHEDLMPIGDGPAFVRAIDLDADGGELDLVVALRNQAKIATLKNAGNFGFDGPFYSDPGITPHRFVPITLSPGGEYGLAVIGEPDTRLVILKGDGSKFDVRQTFDLPLLESVVNIASGDIDGDGDEDLMAVQVAFDAPTENDVLVLYRNQDGILTPEVLGDSPFSYRASSGFLLRDLDRDGDLDVLGNFVADELGIMENLGSGNLSPNFRVVSGANLGQSVLATGDINGDGRQDIIAAGSTSLSQLAINVAPGYGFPRPGTTLQYAVGDAPSSIITGDLDHDGTDEIVAISADAKTYTVFKTFGDCPPPCPADFADPQNVLNFFDISTFLGHFVGQAPAADLAPPTGTWNFFDVSAYLSAYSAGCP